MNSKHLFRASALAFIFALAIAAQANAQQPRMMLGGADQVPDRSSTLYNIQYNDGGFSDPHPNNIRKSKKYILGMGAAQSVSDKFNELAHGMTENHDWFGDVIDKAWERRRDAFIGCGGNWAQSATTTPASSIHITVEPTIWQYSTSWVAGQTDNIGGQHYIKAVNLYVTGITSNPAAADTVDFSALVEWEIGNALADAAGYHATSPDKEVGSYSPCSVVK
jgi:hypothetical protein